MRKLAERAARHIAWRLVRVAAKRLGIPWYLWPFMWVSRKFLDKYLKRKYNMTWDDVIRNVITAVGNWRHGGEGTA